MADYPCPCCGTAANLAAGCPGCGRGPDTEAAEVIRLAGEIDQLTVRADRARRAYDAALTQLTEAQHRRNLLAASVRARASMARPAPVPPPPPAAEETSSAAVQNVLFVLGGLLLGTGAIVFTAVAWATFGVPGRAAILAAVTVLALGVPVLALWRRLTATAETFAAVALLLVLLDGYAAWSVDLAGVTSLPRNGYASGVFAVTAVVALGYGVVTRLAGPRFAALALAQPVVPLAAAELDPSFAGWSLVLSIVAAANLSVLWKARSALWMFGSACFGLALVGSALAALAAELVAETTSTAVLAGAALLAAALVFAAAALVAGQPVGQEIAGGVLAGALALAAGRLVAIAWPGLAVVLVSAVVAAVASGVAARRVRIGPWIGALACLAAVDLYATVSAVTTAVDPGSFDWQLPVAVAVLAAGLVALLSAWEPARPARPYAVATSAVLVVLAASPAVVPALVVAAVLGGFAVFTGAASLATVRGLAAAVLAVHAISLTDADPRVLGALALVGVVLAACGHGRHSTVGGVALAVSVIAGPGAAAAALYQHEVDPWWLGRGVLAAAAALPAAVFAVRRWWPAYLAFAAYPAAGVIALASLWPYRGEESGAIYASVGVLLVALLPRLFAPVAVLIGLRVVVGAAPLLWELLGPPYQVWTGVPTMDTGGAAQTAMAAGVLTVAAAIAGRIWGGLAVAPFALLTGLAAIDAPWPAIPATGLVIGLAGSYAGAVRRVPAAVPVVAGPLAAAGLAVALATQVTTLAGLGLVVATGAAVGTSARTRAMRTGGWVGAVAAAVSLAVAAAFAAGLDRPDAAFWALAAAAAALVLGGFLRQQAVDAAAHAGAVVALLLTVGAIGHAATVCALWGAATGVRAFWPRVSRGLAIAAAGCELLAWWLLLVSSEVGMVEAYTVPAALLALLAGVVLNRANSWIAYGPALAAAFLPSLATVLAGPDAPLRRLLLGLAAVGAVVVGGERRHQAPVMVGGAVLAVLALHELALVWQLLPTWIPLTVAGLLLVWLAVTYERRRRDLSRLRSAVNRMT